MNTQIDDDNLFDKEERNLEEIVVSDLETQEYLNAMEAKEIIELKNNCIPKGLVPLEKLFDNNDVAKNPKVSPNDSEVED